MKSCKECKEYKEYNSITKKCKLNRVIMYEDGCKKCGTPYMMFLYLSFEELNKECPDFDQKSYTDPSGS